MKTYHKNPRQITERQFKDLERWLEELGDLGGIVHDLNSDEVIGGNQRARVFDILKAENAPIVLTDEFDPPTRQGTVALGFIQWRGEQYGYRQVRWTARQCEQANVVANRAGGAWDWDVLANEFEMGDLLEWGFTEFDFQMAGLALPGDEPPEDPGAQIDKVAELQEKWGTALGQVWELGEHRVVCGDCTDEAVVEAVMDGNKAQAVVCDPPFFVRDDQWDRFIDDDDFTSFTRSWIEIGIRRADVVISFMADHNVPLLRVAAAQAGAPFRRSLVWRKPPGSQFAGSSLDGFWFDFEMINVFGKPVFKPDRNTKMAVLEHRTITGQEHGCEKPVQLLEDLVGGYSEDGNIVVDLFLGSGTTLVACERLGRKCRGIEIDPKYIAVTLERWHQMTGVEPVLVQ
jgi:hypothetical protein